MSRQFTPGPWHRGIGNGDGSIFGGEKAGRMRLESGGTTLYPICAVNRGWERREDEGNAVLLEKAPAMFAALSLLLEWEQTMGGFESPKWRHARTLLTLIRDEFDLIERELGKDGGA